MGGWLWCVCSWRSEVSIGNLSTAPAESKCVSLRCLQGHAESASSLLTNSQTGPSSSPEVIGRWPHEGRSWRGGEGGRDCRAVSYIKSAVFTLEIGWVRRRLEWSGTGLFSRCATAVPMGAGKSKDSAYRTVRVDDDGGLVEIQHNARGRIERRRVLRIRQPDDSRRNRRQRRKQSRTACAAVR